MRDIALFVLAFGVAGVLAQPSRTADIIRIGGVRVCRLFFRRWCGLPKFRGDLLETAVVARRMLDASGLPLLQHEGGVPGDKSEGSAPA